jgi:hypothetical protein
MSRHYRAMARIFGTTNSLEYVRGAIMAAETRSPGYRFSIEPLELSNLPENTYGFEVRGATNRRPPGFAELNYSELTSIAGTAIIELLVDDEDMETLEVFQAGKVLYRQRRQEATGDVYELGQPGVEYVQGTPDVNHFTFLDALTAAGVKHNLTPL